MTPPALAQGLTPGEGPLEELIVTGVRGEARTVTDSTVPVDVLGADEFANQGDTDLSNLLRNVVPSYNVNSQPISDAATIVRPANLRGLAPDHTLVLVNGKRRHRAAVIYWLGNGVADGAQGPDISAIPSSALKRVEVLRDGAAAQYGSDAIAGVINFILNDANEGASSRPGTAGTTPATAPRTRSAATSACRSPTRDSSISASNTARPIRPIAASSATTPRRSSQPATLM